MADKIEVPPVTKILSLDEARAAIEGKVPKDAGLAGMKVTATKEFVLTTSLTVATGVAERVYNLMSEQQAEAMAKLEFMVQQHCEKLREEIEGRTLAGRWRRFWQKVRDVIGLFRRGSGVDPEFGVASPYIPDPFVEAKEAQMFAPSIEEPLTLTRKPEGVVTGIAEAP